MGKFFIYLSVVFLFLGCANKAIVHDPLKNELLAYTSKFEIVEKNDKFLALGTYLNPIHSDIITKDKDERFIIAIHPKESKISLSSFSVNGSKDEVRARILAKDDPLLKLVTFNMPWGEYIEVVSPQKISDTLKVEFEIYPSKKALLEFRKVSKSMYWSSTN
ncbi:hypothetical protein [Campylobacter sp. RM16192]|uniref:hypothetical protein n=1 Tax=Campylobacter sp. RM16192 TaxID=1660080 RepID=UPI0014519904|nr:hypothetical protein [Campylobacter sp. RM16192]QCD52956.1 hypothetical protein CDOMC_1351 [Campylobacter sp. RM16192]